MVFNASKASRRSRRPLSPEEAFSHIEGSAMEGVPGPLLFHGSLVTPHVPYLFINDGLYHGNDGNDKGT